MAGTLLHVLHEAADAIESALEALGDWDLAGTRSGQYRSDLAADAAAAAVFDAAGLGWMSEESGMHHGDRTAVVVVDPVDGSTNASRGIPWYATSMCVVEDGRAVAAHVRNLASGVRYDAEAGGGAFRDGQPIRPAPPRPLAESLIALSGYPPRHLGWYQFRSLGAAALDICSVADGTVDGYLDCSDDAHGSWDYLAAMLICHEAGAVVREAKDRELLVIDHAARRTPVAASNAALVDQLVDARRLF